MSAFKRIVLSCVVMLLINYIFIPDLTIADVLEPGKSFPDLTSSSKLSGAERKYLGLPTGLLSLFRNKEFSLAKVRAEAVVVAFFNRYCPACKKQASILNRTYTHFIEKGDLRSKVKFIAIGTGNSLMEVQRFKSQREILFPVLPDSDFFLYDELNPPSSLPLTFVLKPQTDTLKIHTVRIGSDFTPELLIKDVMSALTNRLPGDAARTLSRNTKRAALPVTENKLRGLIKKSMLKPYSEEVVLSSLSVVSEESDGKLYRGEAEINGRKISFYSKAVSRQPLCQDSYGTHFIVTFDSRGVITDFIPIRLTKYGNVPWDKQNVKQIQNRILNHSLKEPLPFRPVLDAVSTATMTSRLIYDSLRRLQGVVEEME